MSLLFNLVVVKLQVAVLASIQAAVARTTALDATETTAAVCVFEASLPSLLDARSAQLDAVEVWCTNESATA